MAEPPPTNDLPRGDRPALSAIVAFAIVGLVMVAYTAGYAWSTPSADTADELLRAYEIRHGIAYPLEGPFLGNALHLGPFWWYLTAVPLWLSHSWLAAALFIGLVCSLKFPLAYLCGLRLVDREFGLLWAVAMFMPGWPSLEPLVFLNPNAVAAAALLVLFMALECLEAEAAWPMFAAFGLSLAVALHVHPTAAPVFLLVAPVLWGRYRRRQSLLAPLAAMVASFLVPFVPYVIGEIRGGFADWSSGSAYVTAQVVPANVVNVPAIIVDYVIAGPTVIAQYLLGWRPERAWLLGAAMAVATATSLAGALHANGRRWLLLFIGATLAFTAWIACTRPTTPFQFTWMLCPVIGGLTALGFRSLAGAGTLRPWVWTVAAAWVACDIWVIRAMAATVDNGEGHLPSRVMDIKNRIPPSVFRDVWFPAYAHARLGRLLCDEGNLTLHGHLAYIADKDLGLDALFECGDRSRLSLAASNAPKHYFGMTRKFWQALGREPECAIGSLGLTTRVVPMLDRAPIPIADGSTYMPRRLARQPPEEATLSFTAPGDAALLVTNVLDGYEPWQVIVAQASARTVAPVAENDFSALYAPQARPGPVAWTVTIKATNPSAIEIVAIDLAPGRKASHPLCDRASD